jgi:3-hexulose-6-phosphate synthase
MTKLQLAIDLVPLDELERVILPLLSHVDVVEAGTPLIKRHGLDAVRTLRTLAPDHLLVADMKTMDAGALEAEMAFRAGADLMTVLACASDATVSAAVDVARQQGTSVVADLIGVPDKPSRARQLVELGIEWLGIHTGTDDQAAGANPLADLQSVRDAVDARLVVAGGINQRTLPSILACSPAIVIVGSGILGQPEPVAAAASLRAILDQSRAGS